MKIKSQTAILFCLAASAIGMVPPAVHCQDAVQNWYPRNIDLPAGHSYPCALTALPTTLEGVPAADRTFINHIYAMLLQCVQAKTIMVDSLRADVRDFAKANASYYAKTTQARQKIMTEPVPAGLQAFRDGVVQALDQQILFFARAAKARSSGTSFQAVMEYSEGRNASNLLLQAWGVLQSKYPALSQPVKESMYHHLCALDLF